MCKLHVYFSWVGTGYSRTPRRVDKSEEVLAQLSLQVFWDQAASVTFSTVACRWHRAHAALPSRQSRPPPCRATGLNWTWDDTTHTTCVHGYFACQARLHALASRYPCYRTWPTCFDKRHCRLQAATIRALEYRRLVPAHRSLAVTTAVRAVELQAMQF